MDRCLSTLWRWKAVKKKMIYLTVSLSKMGCEQRTTMEKVVLFDRVSFLFSPFKTMCFQCPFGPRFLLENYTVPVHLSDGQALRDVRWRVNVYRYYWANKIYIYIMHVCIKVHIHMRKALGYSYFWFMVSFIKKLFTYLGFLLKSICNFNFYFAMIHNSCPLDFPEINPCFQAGVPAPGRWRWK